MNDLQIFTDYNSSQWLDQIFQRLRAEPPADLVQREKNAFDKIASPYQASLVLFGCGYLGRFVLRGLRKAGIEPVAFADNNRGLWGTDVEGVPVLSPADVVGRFGESACFIVAVYHGSAVAGQLRTMGCDRVAPVASLFWKYPDIFIPSSCFALPHSILEREDEIRAGYSVLSDDASRREFCEQVLWRFEPGPGILSPGFPERETYFPDDLVRPLDQEVFVDCGAFNGDSARSFLAHHKNQFGRIFAIEPDPGNREALRVWADTLAEGIGSRIVSLPYGVSDQDAMLSFQITNTAGSSLLTGATDSSIECRRLDTLFADESPTYIKMDIEGAEPEAIRGGSEVLRSKRPVLAVCVYHRCEHMWQIPTLIHSIFPDYRIFLRRYAEDCWEMVCYAVPPDRLAAGKSDDKAGQ